MSSRSTHMQVLLICCLSQCRIARWINWDFTAIVHQIWWIAFRQDSRNHWPSFPKHYRLGDESLDMIASMTNIQRALSHSRSISSISLPMWPIGLLSESNFKHFYCLAPVLFRIATHRNQPTCSRFNSICSFCRAFSAVFHSPRESTIFMSFFLFFYFIFFSC